MQNCQFSSRAMKFSVSSPGWPTNPDSRRHRHPDTKMNATQLSVRNRFSSFNWEKALESELWQKITLLSDKKNSPRCNKMILKETPELHFHSRHNFGNPCSSLLHQRSVRRRFRGHVNHVPQHMWAWACPFYRKQPYKRTSQKSRREQFKRPFNLNTTTRHTAFTMHNSSYKLTFTAIYSCCVQWFESD